MYVTTPEMLVYIYIKLAFNRQINKQHVLGRYLIKIG